MAIKIESKENREKFSKFPKIMKSRIGGQIILATSYSEGKLSGTILRSTDYSVGHVFTAASFEHFEDYKGILMMSNKEE